MSNPKSKTDQAIERAQGIIGMLRNELDQVRKGDILTRLSDEIAELDRRIARIEEIDKTLRCMAHAVPLTMQ